MTATACPAPLFFRTRLNNGQFGTRKKPNEMNAQNANIGSTMVNGSSSTDITAPRLATRCDQEKFNWLAQCLVARIKRTQGIPRRNRSVSNQFFKFHFFKCLTCSCGKILMGTPCADSLAPSSMSSIEGLLYSSESPPKSRYRSRRMPPHPHQNVVTVSPSVAD